MVEKKQEKKKTKPKKMEMKKTEIRGITTDKLINSNFKKIMIEKFGEINIPFIIIVLEKKEALIIFEQTDKESIEKKIMRVGYSPDEISAKEVIDIKELVKEFGEIK